MQFFNEIYKKQSNHGPESFDKFKTSTKVLDYFLAKMNSVKIYCFVGIILKNFLLRKRTRIINKITTSIIIMIIIRKIESFRHLIIL